MRESLLVVARRPQSLTVLRVETGPGLPAPTGAATCPLPPDASAEDVAEAAAKLVREQGLGARHVALGLDAAEATLRRLPFPFTAPGKIDLVLGPEFEPFLTAPPAETALAWSATALAAPPEAVVLAAAVSRQAVVGQAAALAAVGLAPQAACLDLAGLDALLQALTPGCEAVLCVHIEAGRADFVCRLDDAPLAWRSLPLPEANDAAQQAALLAREAALTLSPLAGRPPVGLTLLLGGEAARPETAAALEAALGASATALSALPGWPRLPSGEALPEALALAFGLAVLAAKDPKTANFLRGELAPAASRATLRRALFLAGGSSLVLAACVVGAYCSILWRLDASLDRTRAETEAAIAAAAPELTPGLTLAQKLSALRGRLAERATARRDQGTGPAGGVLEILAAIHQGLGPDGAAKARRVALDESRATIDAVADDYTTVDAVKRRLAAMPVFAGVEIRGAKNNPEKKQVEFQLDLKLAAPGQGAP
jgi:general secretion pathway protein L